MLPKEIIYYLLEFCVDNNPSLFLVCKLFNTVIKNIWKKRCPDWDSNVFPRPPPLLIHKIVIPEKEYNYLRTISYHVEDMLGGNIPIYIRDTHTIIFYGLGQTCLLVFEMIYISDRPSSLYINNFCIHGSFPNLNFRPTMTLIQKEKYLKFIEQGTNLQYIIPIYNHSNEMRVNLKMTLFKFKLLLSLNDVILLQKILDEIDIVNIYYCKTGFLAITKYEKICCGIINSYECYSSNYISKYISSILHIATTIEAEEVYFLFDEGSYSSMGITIKKESINISFILCDTFHCTEEQ